MNLCLRFVTSTVMGLNLAAILLAAILALPAAYADEDPIDEGGGDDGTTIDLVPDCTSNCNCSLPSTDQGDACAPPGPAYCTNKAVCFCIRYGNGF